MTPPDRATLIAWVKGKARVRRASMQPFFDADADHFDAIAALLEAEAWQDISTAPKNGPILVHGGIAHWHEGVWKTLTAEQWPGCPITWPVLYWKPIPNPPERFTEEYENDN